MLIVTDLGAALLVVPVAVLDEGSGGDARALDDGRHLPAAPRVLGRRRRLHHAVSGLKWRLARSGHSSSGCCGRSLARSATAATPKRRAFLQALIFAFLHLF